MLLLSDLQNEVSKLETADISGKVVGIRGPAILAKFPRARLGDICSIEIGSAQKIYAQVVSFNDNHIYLAPFSELRGIYPGAPVKKERMNFKVPLSDEGGGLIIDATGNILQRSEETVKSVFEINFNQESPDPLARAAISQQLATGIKSIDTLCGIGYGQRIGLFAAAGLGKSVLMGMLARNAQVDVNVIALVGERGREIPEFISNTLGAAGLKKSVIVTAASDRPALQRSMAAYTATSIAEFYRNRGKKVLLLVDSLTRMARAIRDVSLAAGELPIRQGLTASVYSELPKLLERAGNNETGSITAVYTLLDSSENEPDPLADEVKSLLDGHISLGSHIANQGIRPAVDFTRSVSRCMQNISTGANLAISEKIRKIIARLKKDKDLIMLGGEPDTELKACMRVEAELLSFLNQESEDKISLSQSFSEAKSIVEKFDKLILSEQA